MIASAPCAFSRSASWRPTASGSAPEASARSTVLPSGVPTIPVRASVPSACGSA